MNANTSPLATALAGLKKETSKSVVIEDALMRPIAQEIALNANVAEGMKGSRWRLIKAACGLGAEHGRNFTSISTGLRAELKRLGTPASTVASYLSTAAAMQKRLGMGLADIASNDEPYADIRNALKSDDKVERERLVKLAHQLISGLSNDGIATLLEAAGVNPYPTEEAEEAEEV